MRVRAIAIAIALAALSVAGCTEPAYVEGYNAERPTLHKIDERLRETGGFVVCHRRDTPWDQVLMVAREQCALYGFSAYLEYDQPYQCRMNASSQAQFRCVVPQTLNPVSKDQESRLPQPIINPFNRTQLERWAERTGNPVPSRVDLRVGSLTGKTPPPPALFGPSAPKAAVAAGGGGPQPDAGAADHAPPATPEPPTPASVAPASVVGPVSAGPLPAPAPAFAPLPALVIPQGSWGDHFQD